MNKSPAPDIFPFASTTVFSFEEIHEGGEAVLSFLKRNYPKKTDLAIGMISHSVKYGADKFNSEIEDWLLTEKPDLKKELVKKIVNCSLLDTETAGKARLHNYLWTGVDLYILKNEKLFMDKLLIAHSEIKIDEVSDVLAKTFSKDEEKVKKTVFSILEPFYPPKTICSISGLVKIWKKAMAGLPEKDKIDEEKTIELFDEIYYHFENQWEEILNKVIKDVQLRMKKFIE